MVSCYTVKIITKQHADFIFYIKWSISWINHLNVTWMFHILQDNLQFSVKTSVCEHKQQTLYCVIVSYNNMTIITSPFFPMVAAMCFRMVQHFWNLSFCGSVGAHNFPLCNGCLCQNWGFVLFFNILLTHTQWHVLFKKTKKGKVLTGKFQKKWAGCAMANVISPPSQMIKSHTIIGVLFIRHDQVHTAASMHLIMESLTSFKSSSSWNPSDKK